MALKKILILSAVAINLLALSSTINGTNNSLIQIDSIQNHTSLELKNFPYNIHKELYFSFNSRIDHFECIRIGQRQPDMKGDYLSACYLEINDSILSIKRVSRDKDTTEFTSIKHNLNIIDTISVHIFIGSYKGNDASSFKSKIQIKTKDQTLNRPIDWYYGHNGTTFFESVNTTGTNGTLTADCADFNRPVLILGDSYMSVASARWPYYVRNSGYFNFLFDALSGATAWDTSFEIERLKPFINPSYILWFLGMNNPDPDEETVQSSWMYQLTNLKKYCDENGIQLIISTIPNTPTRCHVAKNNWIRQNNVKYIDFATAVNATEKGAKWTEGFLSSDNLHPSALGAQALADQLIKDFPEMKELCKRSEAGDVNNDNNIDILDINCILNSMLSFSNHMRYGNRADVNDDEKVDIADINDIVNIIFRTD